MNKANDTEDMRKASEIALAKAEELKELQVMIPRHIRVLTAFGGGLGYVADEIDRMKADTGETVPLIFPPGFTPNDFNQSYHTVANAPASLSAMSITISGVLTASTGSTASVASTQRVGNNEYLKDLPLYFEDLHLDEELIPLLKKVKPSLTGNWEAVRDNLTVTTSEGIKNAIVHARTVADEISWMPDYNHLRSLPWCQLDDKGDPIRAIRYGWIKYGDNLPNVLNGKAQDDELFKSFNGGYKEFGEITHISPIPLSQHSNAVTACNAVGMALVQYLEIGSKKLTGSRN